LGGQPRRSEHFREAARLSPGSVEAHTNLGLSLMEAGRTDEAITEQRRATVLAPESAAAHNNLAMALQQSGAVEQAITEYRAALALNPDYAEAHANLALALASARDYDAAFRHFGEASRIARASGRTDLARQIEDAADRTRAMMSQSAR